MIDFMAHYGFAAIWMALVIIFLVVELVTVGLTTIWLAGGALVAFLLAAVGAGFWLQLIAFFVVSFVLIYFTRPFAVKYLNPRRTRTNSEELIGEIVKVTSRIDNRSAEGTALAKGLEWSARAISDDMTIEKDALVKVVRIEGVKLIVEPVADEGM
ncbi:MAG: NfeD family protein [Lachnospiraceae bacterium]|nr:NfeD family protein [Lachnospiraceae bacterium]MDD7178887.1 NfeD family protein [bacterium]MDY5516196.1 NfeD family protein [Lachnospiraceae bacterium]